MDHEPFQGCIWGQRLVAATPICYLCIVTQPLRTGDMAQEHPPQLLVKPHYIMAPQWTKYKTLLMTIKKKVWPNATFTTDTSTLIGRTSADLVTYLSGSPHLV